MPCLLSAKRGQIRCEHIGGLDIVYMATSLGVLRILQEALTSLLEHSDASRVEVELHDENETPLLKVTDNGVRSCRHARGGSAPHCRWVRMPARPWCACTCSARWLNQLDLAQALLQIFVRGDRGSVAARVFRTHALRQRIERHVRIRAQEVRYRITRLACLLARRIDYAPSSATNVSRSPS